MCLLFVRLKWRVVPTTNVQRALLPTRSDKKTRGDSGGVCQVCAESFTEDIFECNWCEEVQHASCTKLSSEQCNVLSNVTIANIVFFCTPCLQQLPTALKQHDTQVYVDSKFTTLETESLTEIQQAEKKLSDSVRSIELQFEKHQVNSCSAGVKNSSVNKRHC